MAFPKQKPSPPPKDKIIKEKRLVNGKLSPVDTFNGKIVRVFDDEGNIVEDRSSNFGNKLPHLTDTKPKPKEIDSETEKKDIVTGQMENIDISSTIDQSAISQSNQSNDIETHKELTEFDRIMKMPDELFKQEIASMSDSGLESHLKKMKLSSWEKAEIRGRRATSQDKNEEVPKMEDKKQEDVPKLEIPKFLDNLSSTSSPISTSGTGTGIQLISKEETVRQGFEPETKKADIVTQKSEVIKSEITPKEETKSEIIAQKEEDTTAYVPKIEPIIPKIEIPKSEPPREAKDVPIPEANIPVMDRLGKIMEENSDITKSESPKEETQKEVPKAEIIPKETPKIEQSKMKKPKEVKRIMAEEDEEIMQERKFEQWLKKNRFQESVEKTAKISEENQEKIEGISNEITNVKEGLGGVENRIDTLKDGLNSILGETKKPITETLGELCEGVDCIKKDVAKYQDTQSELDKKLDSRFSELRERVQKLEEPTFTCDNCGADGIRPLSSFCPNCGSPIHSWNDDTGQPVKGWTPYWRRINQIV